MDTAAAEATGAVAAAVPVSTGEAAAGDERDLLLFSDIHLGADLKRRALRQAGSLAALASADPAGEEVGSMLAHYAAQPGSRWRLVLAGDVVDFIGINLTPADVGDAAPFELTAEEREYGLEPGPERCGWMMGLVARRHHAFFRHLADFLAAGHELVVVRGNHDAAFVFPEVQQVFVQVLEALAPGTGARVRFEEWFHLEPGRIFVEHGHVYDEMSAEPGAQIFRPDRPNRLNQPVSALLLRYFANRFPSLDLDDVDSWDAWRFIHWTFVRENPLHIAAAFLRTLGILLVPRLRRALRRGRRVRAERLKAETLPEPLDGEGEAEGHATFAELVGRARARVARGVAGAERLAHGLASLVRRTREVGAVGVLRLFFLDRAAALGGGALLSVSFGTAPLPFATKAAAIALVVAGAVALERTFAARRQVAIGPKLRAAAEEVARLTQVPLVVMGHSHKAVDTRVAEGSRYVNLGAWAGALSSHRRPEGGLPHLVVRGRSAAFLRWHGAAAA